MADNAVKSGTVSINPLCSNNCVFCSRDMKRFTPDLTADEEKKLAHETQYFINNGFPLLDISGSEPLRYSKIIAYLNFIRPRFEEITILDPGNMLASPDFTRALVETGVDRLVIPIYGADALHHDAVVGNPGAFHLLIKGLDNFRELDMGNLKIELTSMPMRQNLESFHLLPKFCEQRLGLHLGVIKLAFLLPDRVQLKGEEFMVSFAELKPLVLSIDKLSSGMVTWESLPPCLLSGDELLSLKNTFFFNARIFYGLSDHTDNLRTREIVANYRHQVRHSGCKSCALVKAELCGGVVNSYYLKNENYPFNPVSQETYTLIRNRIISKKTNYQEKDKFASYYKEGTSQ